MAYSKATDQKWQKKWEETQLYKFNPKAKGEKLYCLEMFSYPSGANLHVGHWYNFGLTDSWARFKRAQGYNLFHPMGFDAFGLPAENYAIKTGVHPEDSTINNMNKMREQLKEMGATYDWDYTVTTCMPDYYKWTQWLFLQLYKKGLAYRAAAPVNWCGTCNTVLANEQVVDGLCERCNTVVDQRKLTQWFFKLTDYAEELLADLPALNWPEATKKIQQHWIGKSVGSEVTFDIEGSEEKFTVFTTRIDTLFGVTYVVVAPEHELVSRFTTPENQEAVQAYIKKTLEANEIERLSTEREKTGCFTGSYAVNPANGRRIPIWIADYVLESYGTGCVMAVPSHDERDFAFAEKYNLPIERVIDSADGSPNELPYTEYGLLVNSGDFNGKSTKDAKEAITTWLEKQGRADFKTNYRLRDWLISRQRYWGAPIPIIHCEKCGEVPVPEAQLPVKLPYNVEFKPDGKSPLSKSEEFVNTSCPICGAPARRECDTMDTFVCSSWYFLRYPDPNNTEQAFDPDIINKMLPVDMYVGGREHAAMHLIYARFMTKALRDCGKLSFSEPFKSLVHQGVILGPDGNKMSKSRGNVVSPDKYVDQYGSDVFRCYLMFGFSYVDGGPWDDNGIKAIAKFFSRIEALCVKLKSLPNGSGDYAQAEKDLDYVRNSTIVNVSSNMEGFQFNTAVARLMEFLNALVKYSALTQINGKFLKECTYTLINLLAPMAPHFAEELWELLGKGYSVHNQPWPVCNEEALKLDVIEIPIQVNGKLRGVVKVNADAGEDEIKAAALEDESIAC
ncbi:MAG: leucine--tRNA ligase, partial [Oscillospiraceae bacterium]|nr:leucine--tRNA ligase [Oscillospiraceae bacterium]